MKSLTSLCLVFFKKHFKGYQFEYVFNLHLELRTTDLTSGVQELNFFGKQFEWVLPGLLEK